MSQDPTICTVCGAPRPLYNLGLRGYCGKHRPGHVLRICERHQRKVFFEGGWCPCCAMMDEFIRPKGEPQPCLGKQ